MRFLSAPACAAVMLYAVGAYQLAEVLRASRRLAARGVRHAVAYLLEPARFRAPRSDGERRHQAPAATRDALFPSDVARRVFVTHTHPEAILGLLGPLHTGPQTVGLGYANHGGTLDTPGMLFVNGSTWAHVVGAVARVLARPREDLLSDDEIAALDGRRPPHGVIIPPPPEPSGPTAASS